PAGVSGGDGFSRRPGADSADAAELERLLADVAARTAVVGVAGDGALEGDRVERDRDVGGCVAAVVAHRAVRFGDDEVVAATVVGGDLGPALVAGYGGRAPALHTVRRDRPHHLVVATDESAVELGWIRRRRPAESQSGGPENGGSGDCGGAQTACEQRHGRCVTIDHD